MDQDHMFVITLDWITEALDVKEQMEPDKALAQRQSRR